MRTRTRIAAAIGVIAAASVTGIAVAAIATPATGLDTQAATEPGVMLGHGSDHLPSVTAADWVTYADHVVVVEALSEEVLAPTAEDLERGEGIIGRTVALSIEEVLWSREGAAVAAPATWEYSGLGWHFDEGDVTDTVEMALHDLPRVEVGHRYVMAIRWEKAVCDEDGEYTRAQWRGLGEGSEIPYDDDTIGNGESEGTVQDAAAFAADAEEEADQGVEELLAGQDADAIVTALNSAVPDTAAQTELAAFDAETSCV
ncbi:hypothetical protein [Glycomyces algeriensis]|uniref:Uncharacterized protein n=1 Tax=Glycomyces algeriensis TaxID=256037 RepID=A0A9W6G9L0_9ACTN|nr:hypothetical protein [Glycomyces algeriensis]MDA1364159.1 hypothetical protein [Glycomyces algeriensis]MDR7350184.1 hypothetical protein [Glycomyces algeriensis]GLI42896.1 hypothetical protein GALLR39Z86_27460 [Glycomyces algeriensis]